jgi:proliferating cell nuclear antigen
MTRRIRMFTAKVKDSKVVKGIFDAVSAIITETRLKVDPKFGITMTAMDGSHICLVSLTLKKEDMDEFTSDKIYELGINLEDLVKIIKRGGAKDEITLSHDPKEKKLVIEMKTEGAKKARKFTIALIDIEVEDINLESLNEMQFDNKCIFDLGILDEAIKDAEIFSEVLQIKAEEKLVFSAEGTMGDMEYVLEKEELEKAEFGAKSDGSFAIQFLKSILKITTIASKVEVSLKSESPVKMEFNLLNHSKILYFLAPRVEEDSGASSYEE